ncbi:hypothetical protein [Halobellus ordinarius]|uniref:hypothetical protein n=1 Tax=Halobellus ordinarius TaxID=3075120 RepID=UPI0028809816|nr:hypothetical protein [Halobellus sp. ZY16]
MHRRESIDDPPTHPARPFRRVVSPITKPNAISHVAGEANPENARSTGKATPMSPIPITPV